MIDRSPASGALGCGLLAVALCALGQPAQAQTQSAIVRGQGVAERACAGCHALEGSQGSVIQGVQVPSFRTIAGRGWTPERLQSFIATPHRPMPGIPLELAEIRDLVAYIQSLK